MILRLSGSMAICVLLAACGDKNSLSDLASNEFAAEIDELGSLLDGMQKGSDFGERLASVAAKSPKDFIAGLTKGMTDEAFTFNGLRFDGIKSKMVAKGKVVSTLQAKIAKTYRSPAGLFAAHGLGKKVDRSELAAYFTVAKLGLTALTSGRSPTQELDSWTVARALHVAAALATVGNTDTAALALAAKPTTVKDTGISGKYSSCDAASKHAKEKSYICHTDAVSGSIGYMSADRSNWIDAVSGKEFKSCGDNAKNIKNGWGWIPDPKNPKGGESCHVNVNGTDSFYKDEIAEICKQGSESAKTNADFCSKKHDSQEEFEEKLKKGEITIESSTPSEEGANKNKKPTDPKKK
ncbi:MAG: hypothetical protein FJ146_10150 [Deltaproteobacteria bacterium]|nr:hypothetical protein [Deltaproteobacteria bacterium]